MLGSPLNSKGRASSVTLTPSAKRYPTPPASASPTRSSFNRQHPPPSSSSTQQNRDNELDRNSKGRKRCSKYKNISKPSIYFIICIDHDKTL